VGCAPLLEDAADARRPLLAGPPLSHIRQSRPDLRQSKPDSGTYKTVKARLWPHIRQSRPDSGLDFQVNVLKTF